MLKFSPIYFVFTMAVFFASYIHVSANPKPEQNNLASDEHTHNLTPSTESHTQPESVCTQWNEAQRVAIINDTEVDESSGLADSWLRNDILWTHNDSGDSARLFAISKQTGETWVEVHLPNAVNVDWEDLEIAPCDANLNDPCIYIGDFGDNLARRDAVNIYRLTEPKLPDKPTKVPLIIEDVDVMTYRYPEGARDAETLLVHPVTAALYVIEKNDTGISMVYRIPRSFNSDDVEAIDVAELNFEHLLPLARMATGGSISPDGSEVTIRTYLNFYTFCVLDDNDFESAFLNIPSIMQRPPITVQGEALTYDRGDNSLWVTSEYAPSPLWNVPRKTTPDITEPDRPNNTSPRLPDSRPKKPTSPDKKKDLPPNGASQESRPESPSRSLPACGINF